MLGWPPSWTRLLLLPALFVGFTVHELAHALVAYLLGDTSQIERRRLSFNPLRHVSPVGMAAFLLVGFGWAKPVWVDHGRLRSRNRAGALFLIAIAGAGANLLTGLVALVGIAVTMLLVGGLTEAPLEELARFMLAPATAFDLQGLVVALGFYMFSVNMLLAVFNLIPIPPFDGFQALASLFVLVTGALGRGNRPQAAEAPRSAAEEPARSPAQIHFSIGLQYHQQGQYDEAIARYRQAIGQEAGLGLAHYNMGLAYWAKGRLSLAASALRVAAAPANEPWLRVQAEQRLRELAGHEQAGRSEPLPPPPPLDAGQAGRLPAWQAPQLDPGLKRRVWVHLAVGGSTLVLLALVAWLFVTLATLMALAAR